MLILDTEFTKTQILSTENMYIIWIALDYRESNLSRGMNYQTIGQILIWTTPKYHPNPNPASPFPNSLSLIYCLDSWAFKPVLVLCSSSSFVAGLCYVAGLYGEGRLPTCVSRCSSISSFRTCPRLSALLSQPFRSRCPDKCSYHSFSLVWLWRRRAVRS